MFFERLYSSPLPSTRTGVFYNAFAYPTKISPEVIGLYIAAHTQPGDTVLDVFGGSGSTGIAALLCEYPTTQMLRMAKELELSPVWGRRNALIYEVGKYAAFASDLMCNPPDPKDFSVAVRSFLAKAEKKLSAFYVARDPSGGKGTIRHIIWSDLLLCPQCQKELTYYELVVAHEPMAIKKKGSCKYCGFFGKIEEYRTQVETVFDDLLQQEIVCKKRRPVLVYGQTEGKRWVRFVEESDLVLLEKIRKTPYPYQEKAKRIEWGELYRSGYHRGITHLHHFYTKRNYFLMSYLWKLTREYPGKIGDALRLLLLSYNAAHATLMTRVEVKKNSKDFVVTSAQSGVLYISSLPVEKNIIIGIKRKLGNFERAFHYIRQCRGKVQIVNASSERLGISDQSIDYVFTDPPFGDFIPYAEVNQINELWLDSATDRRHEVIISASQNKDVHKYKHMMTKVFSEVARVLKKEAQATVVFHSARADVWQAIGSAFHSAGLVVQKTSLLNKTQPSFKQVVSQRSVQGDPVILLSKGKPRKENASSFYILDEVIQQAFSEGNRNVRLIYSKYLIKCLERGVGIEVGAKEAYLYINRRFGGEEIHKSLIP